ncbi:hypothetical protein HS7_20530 [Sulfolobales archaeon HS-7]|nr:hypothetical protein HS7_20530 [Sulfolobales archaeon HS-7]
MAIIALIVVHRSVILAIPFFLAGIVYVNYSDDIMPLSNYLATLQEYRKLKQPKIQKQKVEREKERNIKLPKIPTEVQLVMVSVVSIASGFYGIYQSFSINIIGIIVGSVLVGLGLVILLAIVSPLLNGILNEGR